MTKKSEYLGTCQVCFRTQKAPNGKLSLHGYTRPGDGFLDGECLGSKQLPYEHSCETTKLVLANLESHLSRSKEYLAKLENGEILGLAWEYRAITKDGTGVTKSITVHKGDPQRPTPEDLSKSYRYLYPYIPSYDKLLEEAIFKQEKRIHMTETDISYFRRMINAWTLKPLMPVPGDKKKFIVQYKNLVSEYVFDPKYAWDKTYFARVGIWQNYKIVSEDRVEEAKKILARKKKKHIEAGIIEIRVIPFEEKTPKVI